MMSILFLLVPMITIHSTNASPTFAAQIEPHGMDLMDVINDLLKVEQLMKPFQENFGDAINEIENSEAVTANEKRRFSDLAEPEIDLKARFLKAITELLDSLRKKQEESDEAITTEELESDRPSDFRRYKYSNVHKRETNKSNDAENVTLSVKNQTEGLNIEKVIYGEGENSTVTTNLRLKRNLELKGGKREKNAERMLQQVMRRLLDNPKIENTIEKEDSLSNSDSNEGHEKVKANVQEVKEKLIRVKELMKFLLESLHKKSNKHKNNEHAIDDQAVNTIVMSREDSDINKKIDSEVVGTLENTIENTAQNDLATIQNADSITEGTESDIRSSNEHSTTSTEVTESILSLVENVPGNETSMNDGADELKDLVPITEETESDHEVLYKTTEDEKNSKEDETPSNVVIQNESSEQDTKVQLLPENDNSTRELLVHEEITIEGQDGDQENEAVADLSTKMVEEQTDDKKNEQILLDTVSESLINETVLDLPTKMVEEQTKDKDNEQILLDTVSESVLDLSTKTKKEHPENKENEQIILDTVSESLINDPVLDLSTKTIKEQIEDKENEQSVLESVSEILNSTIVIEGQNEDKENEQAVLENEILHSSIDIKQPLNAFLTSVLDVEEKIEAFPEIQMEDLIEVQEEGLNILNTSEKNEHLQNVEEFIQKLMSILHKINSEPDKTHEVIEEDTYEPNDDILDQSTVTDVLIKGVEHLLSVYSDSSSESESKATLQALKKFITFVSGNTKINRYLPEFLKKKLDEVEKYSKKILKTSEKNEEPENNNEFLDILLDFLHKLKNGPEKKQEKNKVELHKIPVDPTQHEDISMHSRLSLILERGIRNLLSSFAKSQSEYTGTTKPYIDPLKNFLKIVSVLVNGKKILTGFPTETLTEIEKQSKNILKASENFEPLENKEEYIKLLNNLLDSLMHENMQVEPEDANNPETVVDINSHSAIIDILKMGAEHLLSSELSEMLDPNPELKQTRLKSLKDFIKFISVIEKGGNGLSEIETKYLNHILHHGLDIVEASTTNEYPDNKKLIEDVMGLIDSLNNGHKVRNEKIQGELLSELLNNPQLVVDKKNHNEVIDILSKGVENLLSNALSEILSLDTDKGEKHLKFLEDFLRYASVVEKGGELLTENEKEDLGKIIEQGRKIVSASENNEDPENGEEFSLKLMSLLEKLKKHKVVENELQILETMTDEPNESTAVLDVVTKTLENVSSDCKEGEHPVKIKIPIHIVLQLGQKKFEVTKVREVNADPIRKLMLHNVRGSLVKTSLLQSGSFRSGFPLHQKTGEKVENCKDGGENSINEGEKEGEKEEIGKKGEVDEKGEGEAEGEGEGKGGNGGKGEGGEGGHDRGHGSNAGREDGIADGSKYEWFPIDSVPAATGVEMSTNVLFPMFGHMINDLLTSDWPFGSFTIGSCPPENEFAVGVDEGENGNGTDSGGGGDGGGGNGTDNGGSGGSGNGTDSDGGGGGGGSNGTDSSGGGGGNGTDSGGGEGGNGTDSGGGEGGNGADSGGNGTDSSGGGNGTDNGGGGGSGSNGTDSGGGGGGGNGTDCSGGGNGTDSGGGGGGSNEANNGGDGNGGDGTDSGGLSGDGCSEDEEGSLDGEESADGESSNEGGGSGGYSGGDDEGGEATGVSSEACGESLGGQSDSYEKGRSGGRDDDDRGYITCATKTEEFKVDDNTNGAYGDDGDADSRGDRKDGYETAAVLINDVSNKFMLGKDHTNGGWLTFSAVYL